MSSNFDALLKNNKTMIVSQTLKVPTEVDLFASDVAAALEVSKHEVLIAMLRDGAEIARQKALAAENSFENDEATGDQKEGRFFLLNTNKSQDEDTHEWMVEDNVAAAFCDPCKYKIERIKPGDVVFLYESGKGIIGFGRAEGEMQKREFYGNPEDCFYYKLSDYHRMDKPVSAKSVKEILQRKIPFASTMIRLRDGEILLEELNK
ncbi:hypothetical protein [Enterobacter sp. C2]|uniref:hypothetical protein n=1 Tax=Enterobacter sp. C2 TaxID=2870346 RepID=UPI001CA46BCE|nr:hypothetical protein [Enterobacter sp. C2]